MTALDRLKNEARSAAQWRGHSPGEWRDGPNDGASWAECECGAMACVDTHPAPNGIDIWGSAVAVNHETYIAARLEEIRAAIEAENISYGEIAEPQSLAEHIQSGDVLLAEWAGIPEEDFRDR